MPPFPPPPVPSPPARRRVRGLAAGAVLVLLAAAVGVVVVLPRRGAGPEPEHSDPRLSYAGPFRNVRPEVGYVGDSACRDCHGDIARAYALHPMGRSLAPVRDVLGRPPHDGPDARFQALGAAFLVERQGRLRHHMSPLDRNGEPVDSLTFEVDYVIGSGSRGHSHL